MKCSIVTMTPQLAKELLKRNVANRNVKPMMKRLAEMMTKGQWLENGESIIVDSNGVLVDGQHRLLACIEAKHSFDCVLVTDVTPKAMESVDSGSGRTLADVFKIAGFSSNTTLAALTTRIIRHQRNRGFRNIALTGKTTSQHQTKISFISRQDGLEFAKQHEAQLMNLIHKTTTLYLSQTIRYFSHTDLAFYLYALNESMEYNQQVYDYLTELCGIENNSQIVRWLHNTFIRSRLQKKNVKPIYKHNAIVSVYAKYRIGSKGSYTSVPLDMALYINDFYSNGKLKPKEERK